MFFYRFRTNAASDIIKLLKVIHSKWLCLDVFEFLYYWYYLV